MIGVLFMETFKENLLPIGYRFKKVQIRINLNYWLNKKNFKMKVKDFMVPLSKMIYLDSDATVDEVSQKMLTNNISSVVIVKKETEKKVLPTAIGLVTKTDLLVAYSSGKDAVGKEKIVGFVQKKILMVNQNEDREKVAEFMVKNSFHHLIIGNDDKEIVGIISSLDLAREFVEDSHSIIRRLFGIPKQRQNLESFVDKTLEVLDKLVPHQEYAIYAMGY